MSIAETTVNGEWLFLRIFFIRIVIYRFQLYLQLIVVIHVKDIVKADIRLWKCSVL